MEENGIKVSFMAEQLGVGVHYLYALINEVKEPSLALACRIEKVTKGKVKPRDLLLPAEEDINPASKPQEGKSAPSTEASEAEST